MGEEVNETISCAGEGGEPPPTLSWKLPKSINQYSVYEAEGSSLLTGKPAGEKHIYIF